MRESPGLDCSKERKGPCSVESLTSEIESNEVAAESMLNDVFADVKEREFVVIEDETEGASSRERERLSEFDRDDASEF